MGSVSGKGGSIPNQFQPGFAAASRGLQTAGRDAATASSEFGTDQLLSGAQGSLDQLTGLEGILGGIAGAAAPDILSQALTGIAQAQESTSCLSVSALQI